MPKVLFVGDIHQAGHRLFDSRPDYERVLFKDPVRADLMEQIGEVDAIVLRKLDLTREVLERAGRLKIVSRHGVGCDNMDVPFLTERGIPVATIGTANADSVAEHAMMLLLAAARRLPHCMDLVRSASDADRVGFLESRDGVGTMELKGRTLLIVGFGRIGRCLATLAAAFDMEIVVADPFVEAVAVEGLGYRHVAGFELALSGADAVALSLPADPKAPPLFQATQFAAMKPGSIFVNVSRGSLVNEADLAEAMGRGHLLGAGTDVWQKLPPGSDHPFMALEGMVMTPHCAAHTEACLSRMAEISVQNVFDFFDGRLDPRLVFNREALRGS